MDDGRAAVEAPSGGERGDSPSCCRACSATLPAGRDGRRVSRSPDCSHKGGHQAHATMRCRRAASQGPSALPQPTARPSYLDQRARDRSHAPDRCQVVCLRSSRVLGARASHRFRSTCLDACHTAEQRHPLSSSATRRRPLPPACRTAAAHRRQQPCWAPRLPRAPACETALQSFSRLWRACSSSRACPAPAGATPRQRVRPAETVLGKAVARCCVVPTMSTCLCSAPTHKYAPVAGHTHA